MRAGIIGLPQSGKTTVFNALTGAHGEVGGYHEEGTIEQAVLKVPDPRLDRLGELYEPDKLAPASIEFEDITGGFAHRGESSRQALDAMREMDALLVVLRYFGNPSVPHPEGSIDPARDMRAIRETLIEDDLQMVRDRMEEIKREVRKSGKDREILENELEALQRCEEPLSEGTGLDERGLSEWEQKRLEGYNFLTRKPMVYLQNIGEEHLGEEVELEGMVPEDATRLAMCGELELEIAELDDEDKELFMEDLGIDELASGKVVRACYRALGLRSFFVVTDTKVTAWTVTSGQTALDAARLVHGDRADEFARAEVIRFDDLDEIGSVRDAKSHGKVRQEGRDYEIQDGDVVTFRFNR